MSTTSMMDMPGMIGSTKEFTWGGVVSGDNKEIDWNPIEEEEEEQDELLLNHCLFLKQAVLGEGAVEGERNIVEVETADWRNKKIQQPIFSLKLGLNECCSLDLTLLPPVKMRLKSGTGPVHITGTHAMEEEEDEDYMMNGDTEEDASLSDLKSSPDLKSKKRQGSALKGSAKKRKVETNGTDEDEDEEEDEDEDDEEGEDEEDGEEDDEEGEEDDEDEEEDEEESMEEDETDESSPEKPAKKGKKGKQNGTAASKKKGKSVQGKGKKMTVEEIKKDLSQSSAKPKKEDKFNSLIRSKYNLNDAKKLQDLWSWFKTNQLCK